MQKWEYMQLVRLKGSIRRRPAPWDDDPELLAPSLERLNELGQKGWQLAGMRVQKGVTTYILMRPIVADS